jgi:hypothetical protein
MRERQADWDDPEWLRGRDVESRVGRKTVSLASAGFLKQVVEVVEERRAGCYAEGFSDLQRRGSPCEVFRRKVKGYRVLGEEVHRRLRWRSDRSQVVRGRHSRH